MNLLARLVAESAEETKRRRSEVPASELKGRAAAYRPRDFARALRGNGLAVIAEMKQRTPSMGVLTEDYRPGRLAELYEQGGAAALSVLTQEASFGGSLEHLREARAHTSLPILRKDFITDPYQVYEARAAGADAVLLIFAALRVEDLINLIQIAGEIGLSVLVEVHGEREAKTAVEVRSRLIGINHRDLRTFEVDLGLTRRIRPHVPENVLVVAESGIRSAEDARLMREAGADAVLVGELLMRSADPTATIKELANA